MRRSTVLISVVLAIGLNLAWAAEHSRKSRKGKREEKKKTEDIKTTSVPDEGPSTSLSLYPGLDSLELVYQDKVHQGPTKSPEPIPIKGQKLYTPWRDIGSPTSPARTPVVDSCLTRGGTIAFESRLTT
eukprot:Selendium_serpulae@DN2847_c0_g1_i2.p1